MNAGPDWKTDRDLWDLNARLQFIKRSRFVSQTHFLKEKVKVKETWWRVHRHANVWKYLMVGWERKKKTPITNSVYLSHSLGSQFPQGPHLRDASSNDAAFTFIGFLLCTWKPRASFISKMTPSFSALVGTRRSSQGHLSRYEPWREEEPEHVRGRFHVFAITFGSILRGVFIFYLFRCKNRNQVRIA